MDFFFDSHLHPSLKKQFANPAEVPTSGLPTFNPWRTTATKEFLAALKPLVKCLLRPFVESSLASQASLTQLNQSNYKIAMLVLFAPDRGILQLITDNKGFNDIVKKGGFGNILLEDRFQALAQTNDTFAVLERDLELLFKTNDSGLKIEKLLTSNFNPSDTDVLHAVFAIEGLHCLRRQFDQTDPVTVIQDITTNLDRLLQDNVKIIAINIAHIDSGNDLFANQAYSADGFRESGFHEDQLRPVGNGFTPLGEQIAKELYKREVLPDVKHMSWLARKQFYAFRDKESIESPIVCSHAGFTGCWFNKPGEPGFQDFIVSSKNRLNDKGIVQRKIALAKPCKKFDGIGFNVSTINLFNEDIEAIFNSDGLIGLSLDQRILGYTGVVFDQIDESPLTDNVSMNANGLKDVHVITDTDFISENELKAEPVFGKTSQNNDRLADCVRLETYKDLHANPTNVKNFIHPRQFYMHVLHAMQLAQQLGGEQAVEKMLGKTLCIGSDMDGLIDGLDCCPDVARIADFKNRFVKEFPKYLKEFKVSLPASMAIAQVADRLFFENGRDFIFSRLDALNQGGLVVPVAHHG
ncbi:hypothetical protein ACS5NO_13845 [Larkinella sp. GY13]|uniref:hypothetical protein n=1 Tax=Larkinella sp. GY13 TaxID=3453720 RepID=UPI003EEAC679